MVVKCRICAKTLNPRNCFMVDGKPYCSEEEYNEYIHTNEQIDNLKNDIEKEVLYIFDDASFLSRAALTKEWKTWNEVLNNENLLKMLTMYEVKFKNLIGRLGDVNQYNKLRYLSAVIQNSVGDFLAEQEQAAKHLEEMAAIMSRPTEGEECTKWHRYVSKREKLRQAKEACRKRIEEMAKEIEIE